MVYKLILTLCLVCVVSTDAYRYLLVFTIGSPSMSFIGVALSRSLIEAGHEVVFITPFATKDPPKERFREININSMVEESMKGIMLNITDIMNTPNVENDIMGLQMFAVRSSELALKHKAVKELLEDDSQTFDAVIVDLYESELLAGLSLVYDCPLMWAYSVGVDSCSLKLIDGIANPAYISDYNSKNTYPLSFTERVEELWNNLKSLYIEKFYARPKEIEVYQEIFGPLLAKQGRKLPDFEDIVYNVSFIFGNAHLASENLPQTPRNHADIGGIHIQEPVKPLPKNLQEIFDNAKHGVIYFSLGTNWKSSTMPKILIDNLLNMFGKLKQTVVWKFEADLPDKPSNVHTVKFAPQHSVLAHPNLIVFITHGGLLSATEAVHFGVPLITVPVFFDQYKNANLAVKRGYGLKVEVTYNMAEDLAAALNEMIANPKYKSKVLEYSKIYHGRLLHPAKVFVHWAEHVVQTKGAPHLRSPALHLPFYQKLYLDLLAALTVFLFALSFVLYKIVKSCFVKNRSVSNSKSVGFKKTN